MKNIYLLFTLILGISLQPGFSQAPCSQGTIIINGQTTDAISLDNDNFTGLNLPIWITAGSTIATGDRVHFVSIIEFNEEPQTGGGNTLVYNQTLNIGSTTQTVPANKVWKVEGIVKYANPFANGLATTNSSPICDGDNLNLTATTVSGATYSWTGPNSFTSASQNPTINGATLADAGMYYVTASLNGCSYTDSTNVVVNALPNSSFTHSATPTAGYPVTFTPALSGQTYAWTFASGTPGADNIENPTTQWASAGSYNVTLNLTDGNGCISSTTNSVTVVSCQVGQPQSNFTWSPNPAIENVPTTFTPNNLTGSSYSWNFDQASAGTNNVQIPNDVEWTTQGSYDVTLTTFIAGICYTTTQSVTVIDVPPITTVTFTNCGQTGRTGPTQTQCNNEYTGSNPLNGLVTVTGGIQHWVVPAGVTSINVEAWGAQGGGANGGLGAYMSGDFTVTPGETIKILVGQQGLTQVGEPNSVGGGGGSFVIKAPFNTNASILVIAGGGGGSPATYSNNRHATTSNNAMAGVGSTSGSSGGTSGSGGDATSRGAGGGGFSGNGACSTQTCTSAEGGYAFVNGGLGGNHDTNGIVGSFGGGGAAWQTGFRGSGGGGGYSGGGSGYVQGTGDTHSGGGGGSYNNGTNQTNTAGVNSGHGQVIITY